MDVLMLTGRILFGVFFLASGIGHLTKSEMMAGYMRSSGAGPAVLQRLAQPVVLLTGVMLVAGSVMVAAGIYGDLGALLLAAFVVPTTPLMHGFWKLTDPMQRQMQQQAFLRNVTYLGAALFLFAYFAASGEGLAYTVTAPLWSIN
jgi:putative oxidoreductase